MLKSSEHRQKGIEMKVRIQETLNLTDNQVEGAKRYQRYISYHEEMTTREFIQWLVFVDGMQTAVDRFIEFSPNPREDHGYR